MTISRVNLNSNRLVVNLTFYLDHVQLELILLVIQHCVNLRYTSTHILNCRNLSYIVLSPLFFTSSRTISKHMISTTIPTLNRLLPWSLSHYFQQFGILESCMSLRIISEKWCLSSLLPLFHLTFCLVFPSLLKIWCSPLPLIKTLSASYGFFQCIKVIILYLVIDK
jgi:hypothetical protein